MSRRAELLAYLLEREGLKQRSTNIIPRRDAISTGRTPLSFSQERFWFFDQFERARPLYNGCKAVRLVGNLRPQILEECFNLIVQRHEVLRTTYPVFDGIPFQSIAEECSIHLEPIGSVSADSNNRCIYDLLHAECLQPLDPSRELPIRAKLFRLDSNEHVLILNLHQIASDSQSMAIFFRELWDSYDALVAGKAPDLRDLPVQYRDFAAWQRDWALGLEFQLQRNYWVGRLKGELPVIDMPFDRRRLPVQRYEGARLPFFVDEKLQFRLREVSGENGVTLFMTLLAAFKTLIYRYTSQEDLIVGVPILNRGSMEIDHLIGSFVNTLALRTNLSGKPSFRELLQRVRETCLGGFANQKFPFEKLVEELNPPRHAAHHPIFQIMFAFQNTMIPAFAGADLWTEILDTDAGLTKFDMTVSVFDRELGITGFIEYSTDLFDRRTIEQMALHFKTLLESIVANPDQSINTLPILTRFERRQLLDEWNDTFVNYPKDRCVHHIFEDQVEHNPEAFAVQFENERITYRDVNGRANQLARYLMSLGAGPETMIGVFFERSIEMVVGLLGVLKSGAAYLPLEPAYPRERLRLMLTDANVSFVLTAEYLLDQVQAPRLGIDCVCICLDRDWPVIARQSDDNPKVPISSEKLIYVMFTSGSTGTPKGVMVTHRAICNRLLWMQGAYRLTDSDKVMQKTPLSFDVSVWEIFWPLLTGASLIMARPGGHQDPQYLVDIINSEKVTVVHFVPSMLKTFLEEPNSKTCRTLRRVVCSGEVLSASLQEKCLATLEATLHNLYGPTEAAVDVTYWDCVRGIQGSVVPIGRPIANTQIYILDSMLSPVPVGVAGELYIAGDCLARGYLNRPDLTEEKFIRNPFSDDPNSRLYRTGDVAKYRADGNIEFLGRADSQVKIRGNRVELGEIEATLNKHPVISESVVVACDRDASGEKDLAGFFVTKESLGISGTELRNFLKATLPEYMIPAFFVRLEALPHTLNGKVDRNALPSPRGPMLGPERGFLEPRTELEDLIVQIWREVLQLDRVGVQDNFFDLGGHSLLATRVVSRLRANLKVELPLRKLFELPTVAQLSEEIDAIRRGGSGVSLPPIVPVSRDRQIPLAFSQQRLWFLRQIDPHATAYNIPSVFRVRGPLTVACLEQALNELIARHEVLRTIFAEQNGRPAQIIAASLVIAVPVIDLGNEPDAERDVRVTDIALAEARTPFDLLRGPLLRAKIIRLGEAECVFVLMVDHTILDGTSKAMFLKELSICYDASLVGQAPLLPVLPLQYADYAVWQNDRFTDGSFDMQLAYWKRRFEDRIPATEIHIDHGRAPAQTSCGARIAKPLSQELTSELKALSRREGVTLFMVLLAAFDILFSRHTGSDDFVIGSTIAGRSRPETENLIGFFINALPLRVSVAGNPTFVDLLKRVRDVCLDAYTHQDVSFEKIVEAINPQRDLSRNPLFQILFNVADVSERFLPLRGCEVTSEQLFDPEAKFDLTLYAPEKEGALELAIVYNLDLFEAPRIAALLDQYEDLLVQAVAHPERTIAEYDLLTDQARAVMPNPLTPLNSDWRGAIHELFSRCAGSEPDRLAVSDAVDVWSYTELEQASNRLANDLIAKGVAPTDCVAVYAHRDASLVVALMAVLKAGAVFTILDPGYPAERLLAYLRLARPKGWIQLQGAGAPAAEICRYLDATEVLHRWVVPAVRSEMFARLGNSSDQEPAIVVEANSPAYIAFTSGSTGEPKGVLSRHGPITHFLPWQNEAFDLRQDDRFALLSGLAYNHLHRDVFTPLANGAALVIPPAEIAREPEALVAWIRSNSITVLHLTPALGQLLLTASGQTLTSIRRIFFGGDVLTQGEVARIRKLAPNATIACFYGATETQRAVGYYEIPDDFETNDADANLPIPLGRGIEDVQLLVLNQNQKLAGIGELGELYIRSPHLAEGYVNDVERARQAFVTNPFTNDPADRLYKTGELARYRPDGNVEWAGRNDRRVNIRGFRVELEEIEAVLQQHPTVKDAVVILRDHEAQQAENSKLETRNPKPEKQLVAYVVTDEEPSQSLSDLLHGYLSARLPDYMVPAHFVVLEKLPLSPNGKVDYRALPSPIAQESTIVLSQAPRNEVEAKLCDIFKQVLARESVGIEENFFRIGGHSLLAAQAAARVREVFEIAFDLRLFFATPTVVALAKELELRLKSRATAPIKDDTGREEIEI